MLDVDLAHGKQKSAEIWKNFWQRDNAIQTVDCK